MRTRHILLLTLMLGPFGAGCASSEEPTTPPMSHGSKAAPTSAASTIDAADAEAIADQYVRRRWPELPLKRERSSFTGDGWMVHYIDLSYDGPGNELYILVNAKGRITCVMAGM
jgi:hypothetical protein